MARAMTSSPVSRPFGRHDVQGELLGGFGAAGEGFLAKSHQLARGEQVARIGVGGYA